MCHSTGEKGFEFVFGGEKERRTLRRLPVLRARMVEILRTWVVHGSSSIFWFASVQGSPRLVTTRDRVVDVFGFDYVAQAVRRPLESNRLQLLRVSQLGRNGTHLHFEHVDQAAFADVGRGSQRRRR